MSQMISVRDAARFTGGWRAIAPYLTAPLVMLLCWSTAAGILGVYPERSEAVATQEHAMSPLLSADQWQQLAGDRWPFMADLYWMRAMAVSLEELKTDTGAQHLFDMIERTATLDPRFEPAYAVGALQLTVHAGRADLSDRLLELGLTRFPDNWRYLFYMGFNDFFMRTDFLAAADHFEQAAAMEGPPPYIGQLAERFRDQEHNVEMARELLRRMSSATENPADRRRFQQRLQELQ